MNGPDIVWVAAADARGHLARAHLARGLLARRGVAVDIVTTSEEGRRFLAALGSPSTVLSPHYGVAFDAWQNMDRRRTEACILRYFLEPGRGLRDLVHLSEMAAGARCVVNDFHPLLLLAGERVGRVVHVYGASLYRAIARHFEGRGPALLDRQFAGLVASLAGRAHARVEHGLGAPPEGAFRREDRTFVLPPLIALPRRSRQEVRAALGVGDGAKGAVEVGVRARGGVGAGEGRRLAAVYLNPHFRDPSLAGALRRALGDRGYVLYGVGEGLAGHGGFASYDGSFADVAAAADLLVSAPGMASCAQARAFGLPFVALATDQPEQRSNLEALSSYPGLAPVDLLAPAARADLAGALGEAIDRAERAREGLSAAHGAGACRAVHERWGDVLEGLLPRAGVDRGGGAASRRDHPPWRRGPLRARSNPVNARSNERLSGFAMR